MRLLHSMRHITRFSAPLVAALSFGVAACDSDESTPDKDTNTQTDTDTTSPDADVDETTPDATDTADQDTTPSDPCESNPCSTVPGPRCSADGAGIVTSTGPGVCTASGTTASCSYTESTTACGAEQTCASGACVDKGDACDYAFDSRVSYVTEIKVVKSDDCCFDFNDDGKNDNALGNLLTEDIVLAQFNVNTTLAEQIDEGGLVLLLETKNVTDLTASSNVSVNGFYGVDADADLENNAAGTSAFSVNPSSFAANTASPYISFSGASIVGGTLGAGPSIFRLSIPLLGASLDLAINGTRFEAPVAAGPLGADGGLALGGTEGGKLGGYVAMRDFAAAFNTYLDTSCTCVTKKDATKNYVEVTTSAGAEKLSLNVGNGNACTGEGENTCKTVGDTLGGPLGGALVLFIKPDIDSDNDTIKESLSIGVRLKATSATIDGVVGCGLAD